MLLRFRVSNFRSIREEQELSLVASSLKGNDDVVRKVEGLSEGVLPAAAIYGANASGKTNVLRALAFACSAVEDSQASWKPQAKIPREPFRLDAGGTSRPTVFEIDILLEGNRYDYRFELDADRVQTEQLYTYPERRRRLLFKRAGQNFTFGKYLDGPNQTIEKVTRPNSLFLSAAAQNNHRHLSPVYRWFAEGVRFVFGPRDAPNWLTLEACKDPNRRVKVERLLRAADLGILAVEAEAKEVDGELKKFFDTFTESLPDDAPHFHLPQRFAEVSFLHKCEDQPSVELGPFDESAGTLAYFGLLGPVLGALESGGLLVVDELDSSLHPNLALEIVRIFNDRRKNPRSAQLVFNTHDTNLLDASVLRRDQIWFTEKDSCGGTVLYPLTDYKPRRSENLERGYLQGRYGAIPFLRIDESWPEVADERGGGEQTE